MVVLRVLFITILATYIFKIATSLELEDSEIWDWNIVHQNKQWQPSITSGPTILVASNITTIHTQNGEDVKVQLSNNNVGIGMLIILRWIVLYYRYFLRSSSKSPLNILIIK